MKDEDKTKEQLIYELAELRRQNAKLETLRESEEIYRYIVENDIFGISMTQDGNTIYANDTYCSIFGYEREELVGKSFLEVVAPEQRSLIWERSQKRAKGGQEPDHYVFKGMKKDGAILFIEISIAKIFVHKDKTTILAIFRDVTRGRKLGEELLRTQKLESLGILAGGIAHDFNNILTAILGNIFLARVYMETGKSANKILEKLTGAELASARAKDLTQQLLIFSKGGRIALSTTSIGKLLRDSVGFALSGSNVRCEFSIPDDLWKVEIDEGQMNQIINNLIINAEQAMSDGGIIKLDAENVALEVQNPPKLKPGTYVKISIKDQGIGIPEENLQRIFDPYFTTKEGARGLGLSTSYSIIEKYDGHITVQSQPGDGATFHIYLPASLVKAPMETPEEKEIPIMGKGRILVMDDEESIREIAVEMLSNLGYEASTATDGVDAIRIYRHAKRSERPFDVVILDLTIPGGMGGKETVQRLRKVDPGIKAVVSSGYTNDPIMTEFGKYGFRGVIVKPYRTRELSGLLKSLVADE